MAGIGGDLYEALCPLKAIILRMPPVTAPTIRFTIAEFMKMAEADVFGDRRVELLNGRIYRMRAQRDPHMAAMSKINRALQRVQPDDEWIIIQGTLQLNEFNAPDPDFQWFDVPLGTPQRDRPLPMLLIEVSHTTYKRDAGVKLRIYAEAGIEDYWIVNLCDDRIEVYRRPQNPSGNLADCRYDSIEHWQRGQTVAPLRRPNLQFRVDDLLP